jgi:hypothetical protein
MTRDGFKNVNPTAMTAATRGRVFCGFMDSLPNVDPDEEEFEDDEEEDEDDEQENVEGDDDDEDDDDEDDDVPT